MRRFFAVGSATGALSLSPLVVSVATFISVPIILGTLGPELWVSITIGQAIGEISRALVVWGWNSIGLTIVAPMSAPERLRYYFTSIVPRLLILLPVMVGGIALAYVIPSVDPSAAAKMAVVGAIYGLTGGWLFISNGEPLKFLFFDAFPRATSILLASVLLLFIPNAGVYGWVNILGSIVAVALPFVFAWRRAGALALSRSFGTLFEAWQALVRGLPIVGSVLVMVFRISFPVLAAPYIAPLATPIVSLGDKFFRWANTAMTPFMQVLLVRIPRGAGTIEQRAVRGLQVAWAGGVLLGGVTALVVWLASPLLSHNEIILDWTVAIPLGVAVMMVFVAGIGGNSVLVMFGRVKQVFSAGVVALIVLVVVALLLTPVWGAGGIFWAFAASESVVVAYQSLVIFSELRNRSGGNTT